MSLTSKQQAFVNAILKGANPSEAYREAYKTENMNAASVAKEAHKLVNHPNIAPILEKERIELMQQAIWSRRTAIEQVMEINALLIDRIRSGDADAPTIKQWLGTVEKLNQLSDVTFELAIRRSMYKRAASFDMSFDDPNEGMEALADYDKKFWSDDE